MKKVVGSWLTVRDAAKSSLDIGNAIQQESAGDGVRLLVAVR